MPRKRLWLPSRTRLRTLPRARSCYPAPRSDHCQRGPNVALSLTSDVVSISSTPLPPTELTLLHQNFTIAGGGTVTIRNVGDTAVYIRWSTRILVTPLCNKASVELLPASNVQRLAASEQGELTPMMVSSSGNPTNSYAALYYVLPTTQTTDTNLSPPRFNYGTCPWQLPPHHIPQLVREHHYQRMCWWRRSTRTLVSGS
jgi:hypothetical protein